MGSERDNPSIPGHQREWEQMPLYIESIPPYEAPVVIGRRLYSNEMAHLKASLSLFFLLVLSPLYHLLFSGLPLARSIILHLAIDDQTMESAAGQVGSLIALISKKRVFSNPSSQARSRSRSWKLSLIGGKIL